MKLASQFEEMRAIGHGVWLSIVAWPPPRKLVSQ